MSTQSKKQRRPQSAPESLFRTIRIFTTPPPDSREATVAAYEAEDDHGLPEDRPSVAAVIRYSSGKRTVSVLFGKHHHDPENPRIRELATVVRAAEQDAHGSRALTTLPQLRQDGDAGGKTIWNLSASQRTLSTGTSPTEIDLEYLLDHIARAVDPRGYAAAHEDTCKAGLCVSRDGSCPWFPFELPRCNSMIRSGGQQHKKRRR